MANTGKKSNGTKTVMPIVASDISDGDKSLRQVYKITEKTSEEDIVRYANLPGVDLEFDVAHFQKLSDSFVATLPASAQKSYWTSNAEVEARIRTSNRALVETPNIVDPMSKLLDGPHGMANPLTRDEAEIKKLMPGYYITWRVEGGQGDIDAALRAGFRVMRRPKDKDEEENLPPNEWSGERWKVRDGLRDPASDEEIYNVMVYIREQAWKDNLAAMSMISHNAYSTNKKQFVEGVDNISRDMLSSKERIQVSDLDELHVEEHTMVKNGKRVSVDS